MLENPNMINNTTEHPMAMVVNWVLYACSHTFTAVLLLNESQMKILQMMFSCTGIIVSNMVLIIIHWNKIAKWFNGIEWNIFKVLRKIFYAFRKNNDG